MGAFQAGEPVEQTIDVVEGRRRVPGPAVIPDGRVDLAGEIAEGVDGALLARRQALGGKPGHEDVEHVQDTAKLLAIAAGVPQHVVLDGEYGKYISTTYLGKFEKMAMGPQGPGYEIDDWLYSGFFPEQPHNRSHVADPELNKLLLAQRRELNAKKRLAIVHDIQRYLADKAYYVLPPDPAPVHHARAAGEGLQAPRRFSLGYRVMFTWLER